MDTLKKQVRIAYRRIWLQQFLRVLSWCLFATLLVAAGVIAANKFWPFAPMVQDWHWVAGAAGIALIAAVIWAVATRKELIDAAIELDRRFALKERVSSALALSPAELESEAGRALTADALKRVEKIHVPERFGVRLNRWAWLPLAPGVAAFLLAVFIEPRTGVNEAEARQDLAAVRKQVKESSNALRQKMIERRKEAREKGLKDAEEMFDKLERGTKELSKNDTDRKQALMNLNDLAKDLEQRRKELAGSEQFKQQMNQLKDLKQGPADKLGQAMKSGDFNQAMKEIEKLREEIREGKLSEKAQKQLAEQMADMQQKLQKMVEDHTKKMADLAERIEQKKQAGQKQEAEELQQQLDKLASQNQQMQQMQQMADKMGQCAKCMQNGKQDEAMAGLSDLQADLNQLQQQLDEMEMLDAAMDEIADAKNGMSMSRMRSDFPGDGLGEGRGYGDRPEERTDVKFHDSTVKQKTGRGAAIVSGFVEGPNVKGQVQQEIQEQLETAKSDSADPLTGHRLPRDYRDHTRKYFDAFREGQKE
jgi:hypothetical protein